MVFSPGRMRSVFPAATFRLVKVENALPAHKKGSRRIQESVLLGLAVIFGGVGAMFGMVAFNHKTSKPLFRFVVPVAVVVNLVVLWKIAVLF